MDFLKIEAFLQGETHPGFVIWAAVYKEKTFPRQIFLIPKDSISTISPHLGTIVLLVALGDNLVFFFKCNANLGPDT